MYKAEDHTFVVCAYKENPYLESTIQSLLGQKVLGKVLITTSTPNAHIEGLGRKYDIPVTINPSPGLAGDDWNHGYNAADTPLVTLAHQDDYYDSRYLEAVLSEANRYEEDFLLLFTDYFEIRGSSRVDKNALLSIKRLMNAPLSFSYLNGLAFVKKGVLSFGDPICCPSVTLSKQKAGGSVFDTSYRNSCDYKTWVDLARREGRFIYIPLRLMGHRIYEGSATTLNLKDDIRRAEDAEILAAMWPRPVARLINTVYALSEKSNNLE